MKTRLLLLIALLIPNLALAEIAAPQLLGHWRYTDATRSADYTFLTDGTFTGNIVEQGRVVVEYSGKWSVVSDTLQYEYTASTPPRIPIGTKDTDKLLEVTKEYYVISAQDGSKRTYRRLP